MEDRVSNVMRVNLKGDITGDGFTVKGDNGRVVATFVYQKRTDAEDGAKLMREVMSKAIGVA